jgi:hypothetical protein
MDHNRFSLTLPLLLWGCICLAQSGDFESSSSSKEFERKVYYTTSIEQNTTPEIDGILDDPAWNLVEWATDYRQTQPDDGADPTRSTAFKILYDAEHIYFAFRCYDPEPENIVRRMSRRDGFDGDWIEINIDSYFDKRTAFSFTVSASGVKGDEFVSDDGNNWDSNWNPIWYTKTHIDKDGWTAEMRIPLSQLRYGNKDAHVWGIQSTRRDFRADERSIWQWKPQSQSGWVSYFGELHGIKGIKPQKQIEIQPYVVTSASTFEKEVGNPFADGSDFTLDGGLDGKLGITSDLTLDFTVNPDFGQVEADPSALTLDGFQIFFPEKRPFFIENRNLFDYSYSQASTGGPFTQDNLFYSRRIGRAPQHYPNLEENEYADVPNNTSIIGAAKFSGKTKSGLAIGLLESITAEERATIDLGGDRRKEIVEPFSNYFVSRFTQDFRDGHTVLGGILTGVHRRLDGTGLEDQMHQSAISGGIDFKHWWNERTFYVEANGVFSRVAGSKGAIMRTQGSFEHYFQRPDAGHLSVDPNATDLTGWGGTAKIGKRGNWSFEGGITMKSPKLELNDIGFMSEADQINHFLWSGYRWTKPFAIFRSLNLNYNHWARWDFDGRKLYQAWNVNTNMQLKNFWRAGTGLNIETLDLSNRALFGGPTLRKTPGIFHWLWVDTDSRKSVSFSFNIGNFFPFDPGAIDIQDYSVGMNIQPSNALKISLNPGYFINRREIQNVASVDHNDQVRYVVGAVDQRTLRMSVRLNYSITPNISLQYWGQPFISQGTYTDFKYITNPLAKRYTDRFHMYETDQIYFDESASTYFVDEDRDGTMDYDFGNPDFSFIQFRSNMVFRWEYTPGSELFFVWSQGGTNSGDPREGLFSDLRQNVFSDTLTNIFLVKLTYRFLL